MIRRHDDLCPGFRHIGEAIGEGEARSAFYRFFDWAIIVNFREG
jgi:hypothetical protein